MFSGLSAFPLTPVNATGIDEKSFLSLLARLTTAKVDSLGVLGSTGSYAYFTREQRKARGDAGRTACGWHSGDG